MPQLTKSSPKPDIKRFQLDLEFFGFPLGRFGADGSFGSDTRGAAHSAATKFDLPPPAGDVYPAGLVDGMRALVVAKQTDAVAKPKNFTDLTSVAYTGPREHRVPMSVWEGPLFHTTGCPMGLPSWSREQIHQRWANSSYKNDDGITVRSSLKAHIGITQKGEILLVHPLEWFIWHAQQGSKTHIGIEVESFDYGVPGDLKTLPGGGFKVVPINDLQVQAAMDVTDWLDKVFHRYTGRGIISVRTHCQFTDDRDPDIGKVGYQRIIMPIMQKYGISDGGPEFRKGKGRRIPKQWNPAYTWNYSDPDR